MNDHYAPPASKIEDRAPRDGLPEPLRLACWAFPFLAIGALVAQTQWRFAPSSPGWFFAVGGLLVGALGAAVACIWLVVKLRRAPQLQTLETRLLTWLNGGTVGLALLIGLQLLF